MSRAANGFLFQSKIVIIMLQDSCYIFKIDVVYGHLELARLVESGDSQSEGGGGGAENMKLLLLHIFIDLHE